MERVQMYIRVKIGMIHQKWDVGQSHDKNKSVM